RQEAEAKNCTAGDLEIERHEKRDERRQRRPDAEQQREARTEFAERNESREVAEAANGHVIEIPGADRSGRGGRGPVAELAGKNGRIEQPPVLADRLENEEHADRDAENREARSLPIDSHSGYFSDVGRSKAIAFSAAMRASIGGCDANRSDQK